MTTRRVRQQAGSQTLDEFQRWSRYLINAQTIHLSYLVESEALRLIEQSIADFTLPYAWGQPACPHVDARRHGRRNSLSV